MSLKLFQKPGQILRLCVFFFAAPLLLEAQLFTRKNAGTLTVYAVKGPSGVGMIRLFEDPPRVSGYTIRVEALAQADLLAARFISGEAKLGILPPNMAAKIAASGKKLQVAAVVGTGMVSLLTLDTAVERIGDLRGKTVEMAGQGATPDFVFRRILRSYGLVPGRDITLGYALAYPEIAQALIAGRIRTALLPEPFATMALAGNSRIKKVGDIQDEWVRSGGGENYPMTVLAVDAEYAAAHKDALAVVLEAYRASIGWVGAQPRQAGILVEKHELGLRASVVEAAIPKSSYVFIPAAEAKPALESLFRTFLEFDPASIGGALPPDSFYYRP